MNHCYSLNFHSKTFSRIILIRLSFQRVINVSNQRVLSNGHKLIEKEIFFLKDIRRRDTGNIASIRMKVTAGSGRGSGRGKGNNSSSGGRGERCHNYLTLIFKIKCSLCRPQLVKFKLRYILGIDHILSNFIQFILFYHILSYFIIFYHILSYFIIFYHILLYFNVLLAHILVKHLT